MAHDDSRNPFSSTPGRPEAQSPWTEAQPKPVAGRGGLQLPGEADAAWGNGGVQRPSPIARQRNQWRQHQQLTSNFGTGPDPAGPDQPEPETPTAARNASLPTFKRSPVPPAPSAPAVADRPSPQGPPRGLPTSGSLQMHPHSFQPGSLPSQRLQPQGLPAQNFQAQLRGAAPGATGGLPPNVTPLRPQQRRRSGLGVAATPVGPPETLAARSLAPDGGSGAEGTTAPRRSSRVSAARRRLANPPLPLLYLIRLIILGVGVAAIAGTLLSILSPTNVASSRDGATPAAQNQNQGAKASGALLQGSTANTVTDLRLTNEITRLKDALAEMPALTPGLTVSAFAVDLDSGQYVDLGGAQPVAAASTIKLPILVAFLQQVDAGTMALNQALTLQEEYMAGGSGTLRSEAVGTEYTALDIATRMIVASDNTATNMMIASLGGVEALNQTFAGWGLGSTLLRNPLPDLEGTNTTSAKDLALLMSLVDQGGLLTPRSRDRMFSIMQRTENVSLIPSGIGDRSLTANKTGDIASMLGDVALVDVPNGKRYVLSVMVQRPNNDGRASELIRRMTETVHAEMAQPVAPVGNPNAAAPAPLTPPSAVENPPGGVPQGELGTPGASEAQEEPGIPVTPVPVEVPAIPDRVPGREDVPPG